MRIIPSRKYSFILSGIKIKRNRNLRRQRVQLLPELPEAVPAPVEAGQQVGSVAVAVDGREIARIPVVALDAVAAKGAGWRRILRRWVAA